MAWIRKSDGARQWASDREVWGPEPTAKEISAKKEREVQNALADIVDATSDRDKAIVLLLADLWREVNPGMSMQEARESVRGRIKTHLRKLKRLD